MKGWIIFGLAFVIYFVSIFGDFIQDDAKVIPGDPGMGKIISLVSVWTRPYYYQESEKSVYRPLTSFSFYVNALLTGKQAWGFRLGNVLIYGWVCWLVYEGLKRLVDGVRIPRKGDPGEPRPSTETRNDWWEDAAFWGAILFVVLPIHTEVVNNIVGRAEMLSLGFLLLAMLKNWEKKWEVTALFLLLAMLSKETAVVGVPILLYLNWASLRLEKKEKLISSLFVLMALVGFLALRMMVLGGMGTVNKATMVENPLKFVAASERIANGLALVPFGVGKVLFPVNLSYDYSFDQIKLVDSWLDWRVLVGLGIIFLSGVYLFGLQGQSLKAYRDMGLVGMILFWGPILITGNILFPIGTIFGERLWFLPSLGVVMIALSIGSKTAKNRTPALLSRPAAWRDSLRLSCTWSVRLFGYSSAPILIAILLFYGGRTWARNFDWLSQERLFLHDAKYASQSVMAQSNKAAIYLIDRDLEEAKKAMEEADKIYPKYPELLNNWGIYYLWTGKTIEAKKKFEECLIERPGSGLCQGNLELIK